MHAVYEFPIHSFETEGRGVVGRIPNRMNINTNLKLLKGPTARLDRSESSTIGKAMVSRYILRIIFKIFILFF